jgi:non-specific serine/threonine protein kinase
VRLFVERAVAVAPDFALTPENAPAVAQVCRRLDGVPLALELAAARVTVLAVEQLAQRLDDAFRLLTGGARTALPRQQTLRAAVDWSYHLLTEPERAVLRRAAVFAGGFPLEAAEAVCAGPGVESWEVLDLLGHLVDKSLVQAETRGGAARYRLLETIRLYGRERLLDAGEAAAGRDRHLAWCLRLAEGAAAATAAVAPAARAAGAGHWVTGDVETAWRLAGAHDNLRAAPEWARDRDPQAGLRLAVALGYAWALAHLLPDPGGWLDGLLARAPLPGAPGVVAGGRRGRSGLGAGAVQPPQFLGAPAGPAVQALAGQDRWGAAAPAGGAWLGAGPAARPRLDWPAWVPRPPTPPPPPPRRSSRWSRPMTGSATGSTPGPASWTPCSVGPRASAAGGGRGRSPPPRGRPRRRSWCSGGGRTAG